MRIFTVISFCILLLACSTSRDNMFVSWWNGDPMWITYSKDELKRRECDKKTDHLPRGTSTELEFAMQELERCLNQ